MKQKTSFLIILVFFISFIPFLALADGGMIVWPPKVHLDQTAQNAIVAWNGEEEIIILSNDIESDAEVIALRMVPLPSNPSEIKEGSFASFEKITEIMNEKIDNMRNQWMAEGKDLEGTPTPGVEITFHEQIGAHDVTVVKVNDLDYFLNWVKDFAHDKGLEIKEISSEFREGVKNYLKRDIKYFVFDVINTKETKESIQPLIYQFESDYLYYPLKVTAISEIKDSYGKIQVFFIAEDFIGEKFQHEFPVEFSQEEVKEISEEIADLFESSVEVLSVDFYGRLDQFNEDLILFPSGLWKRDLSIGSSGEDVKILQKFLINMELWDSEAEATGFFGPITKNALAKFQEKEKYEILRPIGLETGTGYFGEKTRIYFDELSVKTEKARITIKEMKYCEHSSDCVPVGCECTCSGCGGFSYEDIVNKKYVDTWYNQQGCEPVQICPEVCCPRTTINCENNMCVVKAGVSDVKEWNRNLYLGMSGDDVKKLQEILIAEGVWQRPDIEPTGYFGQITKNAVIKFQEKYTKEILEPLGLRNGTGYFGASTRIFLQKQIEQSTEENKEYYGSSTYGSCQIDTDCTVSGCNGEVCQSKSEEPIYTICIARPGPKAFGYECKCSENKCHWLK